MSTQRSTHPVNVSYLVVGLVFLGLSASWVLRETGVVDLAEIRWLFPLTLVLAGAVGLVAATARGLSRRDEDSETYVYPGDEHPTDPAATYDNYDSYDSYEGEAR